MAAKKKYWLIPLRIFGSVVSAAVLFLVWAIPYDDAYMWGSPNVGSYDYLAFNWLMIDFLIYAVIGVFLILQLFIWNIFRLKWRLIVAAIIAVCMVCGAAFIHYQENMLTIRATDAQDSNSLLNEVYLPAYEPFREDTLAKSLDGESALHLQSDLPRMDGATALYPLYSAFARATYPAADYGVYDEGGSIVCSRTANAFDNLLDGKADIIFLMGVSEEQQERAEALGLELTLTPIGREAFVFLVNKRNAASDVSVEDIKGIYAGQIQNWQQVGGRNQKILAYQRPETSGSQVMLKEIMGDMPIVEAPEKDIYSEMAGLYYAVAYKNHKNALGYSFRYYIEDMIAEDKIKFLAIDGIEPTPENIASGAYPFAHDFYAVTIARPDITEAEKAREDNTRKLLEWMLSAQGQSLVEKTGYVPLP